jgi:hypothetical protein
MQIDVDEIVHVKLQGPLAELLTKVDPELYTKYVTTERGKSVMYVQLQKALYGTLTASMLFWKDLSGHLSNEGYKANAYDPCVMNKVVNGKQCTVLWHVDDLKVSHVEGAVIEGVLDGLNKRYGVETPLTVTRGDLHDYLGMTIDYSTDGKAAIRMQDYAESMLEDVPDDMEGTATTPAADHLFKVDDGAVPLGEERAELFHSIVAKQTTVSVQTGSAGHSDIYCVSLHTGVETRRGRLQETAAGRAVLERDQGAGTDAGGGLSANYQMVGRRVIWCTSGHAQSYRRNYVAREGVNILNIHATKAEYEKLNRGGAGWRG